MIAQSWQKIDSVIRKYILEYMYGDLISAYGQTKSSTLQGACQIDSPALHILLLRSLSLASFPSRLIMQNMDSFPMYANFVRFV